MNTLFSRRGFGGAFSVIALSLGLGATPALAQERFEWTMISPLTPTISYVPLYQELIDNIAERSDGRLTINLLTFGEHPFEGGELITAVRDGIVEMGNATDAYISAQSPAMGFMALPFLFDSLDHAKEVYEALREPHFGQILSEEYNSELVLGFLISGAAVHADAPLDSLSALDGRSIRVFGRESGQMIELLGGTPATVSFGELYTALQRGTIDGALTGMLGAQAARVYEVVDHATWWNWSYALEFIMVNNDALAALPEDLQTIVREEAAAASERVQALQDRLPAEILVDSLETYGITVTGLTPETVRQFRERTRPVAEEWLENAGEAGQAAFEIYEGTLTER